MTEEPQSVSFDEHLGAASAAMASFAAGPAQQAADDVARAFERAGARITQALSRAAFDGESAMKRLAKTILEELARVALAEVFDGRVLVSGARAGDGVLGEAGGAGLLTQRRSGAATQPDAGVSVHFHLSGGGDVGAVVRHQGQIAAAVARAVTYGKRNL